VSARILRTIAVIELGTFVLLMLNVATVHLAEFSRLLGPIHGLAYLATIISAILICDGQHQIWRVALIPGVGGLLAGRTLEQRADRG